MNNTVPGLFVTYDIEEVVQLADPLRPAGPRAILRPALQRAGREVWAARNAAPPWMVRAPRSAPGPLDRRASQNDFT